MASNTAPTETVSGLKHAKAAFQQLPDIVKDAMLGATEMTVREIARGAQARLLASPSIVTRNLYNAVGWTMNRKTGLGRAGIQNVTTTIRVGGKNVRVKGILTAGLGGSALKSQGARIDKPRRRAHFVEFGTRHSDAEPFMLPAAEAEQGHYLRRCQEAGKTIERNADALGARTI
jgi:hypothetical protein